MGVRHHVQRRAWMRHLVERMLDVDDGHGPSPAAVLSRPSAPVDRVDRNWLACPPNHISVIQATASASVPYHGFGMLTREGRRGSRGVPALSTLRVGHVDGCDNDTVRALLFRHSHFQDRLVSLWEEVARRYRGRGEVAGCDVLNEPSTGPRSTPIWSIPATTTPSPVSARGAIRAGAAAASGGTPTRFVGLVDIVRRHCSGRGDDQSGAHRSKAAA